MIAAATHARLKRACREAVTLSGGVDGAAATTGKARATCGNWNNRNMADTPTLGDAFLLDEVAVLAGERPPIASALVAELGGTLIMLPDAGDMQGEAAAMLLLEITSELGDLADTVRAALADGKIDGLEPQAIERATDDVIERAVQLREQMRQLQERAVVSLREMG